MESNNPGCLEGRPFPSGRVVVTEDAPALAALSAAVPGTSGRAALVTDANVARHHLERFRSTLASVGLEAVVSILPPGEATKSPETVVGLLSTWAAAGLTRSDAVVAFGGGVVGDAAGLAAALYMRGVPFVNCPTSLLAAVDASVGGKTGVNLPQGKNLMGVFRDPLAVLIDPSLLSTLPVSEWTNGMAEVVKLAFIAPKADADALAAELLSGPFINGARPEAPLFESAFDEVRAARLVSRAVGLKTAIVEQDPFERPGTGRRRLLNFGHTLGHALERLSGYTLAHGRAVSAGMELVTRGAVRLGLVAPDALERLLGLMAVHGLPRASEVLGELHGKLDGDAPGVIAAAAFTDKKRTGFGIPVVLPASEKGPARVVTMGPAPFARFISAALAKGAFQPVTSLSQAFHPESDRHRPWRVGSEGDAGDVRSEALR